MSSELERRLRAAREGLPLPAAAATARARARALVAVRRRRSRRVRRATLLGAALVVAIGLGVGIGALVVPRSTAASGPVGMGFLPETSWTVLQTGARATPERQALAIATNVRLHPEDAARGIRDSSGLPYATLLQLPRHGVVIVALFTRRESEPWNDEYFPKRELPLRVREAMRSISYGTQVRPEHPLGQYELRVTVADHHVVLHFYFGTERPSPKLVATAQRQLDRLVIEGEADRSRQTSSRAQPAASRIVDRTVICAISSSPQREIDVQAQSGVRLFGDPSKWKTLPIASVYDPRSASPQTYAWIVAGWPPIPPEPGRPVRTDALSYPTGCRPSSSRVPLSTAGLTGGPATQFGDEYDCVVPQRILLRIRGVFYAPAVIRRQRTEHVDHLFARGRVREGSLAIRTLSGKPIALATVHESGKTRLFLGNTCGPSA